MGVCPSSHSQRYCGLTRRNKCAMKEDLNLHSALKTSCTVLFCAIANSALADPLDSSSFINAPPDSFWTQKYMFGDWGGERTRLEQMGITFYGEYRDDFQGNVTGTDKNGNERDHSVNFGIFYLNLDVDLMKLADIAGEFFFGAVWQYGGNLSDRYLNVHTSTSSIAGTNSERIDQLWYQQGFFDSRLKIKIGQVCAVDEFGATDFFDILVNDELGYSPNTNFVTHQPFWPAGKPGVITTLDLRDITPGLYIKGGAFTAIRDPYHPDWYGVDYASDFDQGAAFAGEVGYKEQNTRYDGVYKLGFNYTNQSGFTQDRTGQRLTGNYNGYMTIEKTVFHPQDRNDKLDTSRGLDLLFQVFGEPDDRNPVDFEVTFGGRYTGLIPGRDKDKVGFGFIYSHTSDQQSLANQDRGGPSLGGEETVEVDYQVQITPWLAIQPDIQAIFNPNGDAGRNTILVLGIRSIIVF
jgi:porin